MVCLSGRLLFKYPIVFDTQQMGGHDSIENFGDKSRKRHIYK